ncbi:MAG: HD domain-containing protein [Synechococcales bacterium]|nr:HD domain-containing protein [Synechococcales bacterium]
MKPTLDDVLQILADRGSTRYGSEAVTQLAHALQCAALAEAAHQSGGASVSPALVTACLLHDMGHLLYPHGDENANQDDRHEYRAVPFLKHLFGSEVTEPIRLHVQAKRYLCATDPAYWGSLSPASQHSLELQGGTYSPDEATAFIQQPFAADAVQLRRWDEQAKVPGQATPDLTHFRPWLAACLRKPEQLA